MTTSKFNEALSKVRYSKGEFPQYVINVTAAMRLHPNKLDSVCYR